MENNLRLTGTPRIPAWWQEASAAVKSTLLGTAVRITFVAIKGGKHGRGSSSTVRVSDAKSIDLLRLARVLSPLHIGLYARVAGEKRGGRTRNRLIVDLFMGQPDTGAWDADDTAYSGQVSMYKDNISTRGVADFVSGAKSAILVYNARRSKFNLHREPIKQVRIADDDMGDDSESGAASIEQQLRASHSVPTATVTMGAF